MVYSIYLWHSLGEYTVLARKGFSSKREDATANSLVLYCLRVSQHPSALLNLDSCKSQEPGTSVSQRLSFCIYVAPTCAGREQPTCCLLIHAKGPYPPFKLLETARPEQANATSVIPCIWGVFPANIFSQLCHTESQTLLLTSKRSKNSKHLAQANILVLQNQKANAISLCTLQM